MCIRDRLLLVVYKSGRCSEHNDYVFQVDLSIPSVWSFSEVWQTLGSPSQLFIQHLNVCDYSTREVGRSIFSQFCLIKTGSWIGVTYGLDIMLIFFGHNITYLN